MTYLGSTLLFQPLVAKSLPVHCSVQSGILDYTQAVNKYLYFSRFWDLRGCSFLYFSIFIFGFGWCCCLPMINSTLGILHSIENIHSLDSALSGFLLVGTYDHYEAIISNDLCAFDLEAGSLVG